MKKKREKNIQVAKPKYICHLYKSRGDLTQHDCGHLGPLREPMKRQHCPDWARQKGTEHMEKLVIPSPPSPEKNGCNNNI